MLGFRVLAAAAALLFGAGPAVAADRFDVRIPPPVASAKLPVGADPQPVEFTRAAITLREGEPWLEIRGPLCLPIVLGERMRTWQASQNELSTRERLEPIFNTVLGPEGFKVGARDTDNLFGSSVRSVDLQLGARIRAIRAQACINPESPIAGAAAVMEIEWQVYSVSQNRILARIETVGGAKRQFRVDDGLGEALNQAFADNVRRLGASEEFRALVLAPAGPPAAAAAPAGELRLSMPKGRKVAPGSASESVVSIITGGGHGSGVLITGDGYILTNHHVAGGSGKVRVRWADGTETPGEVIRGDSRRDVALIKTTPKATPLAVRMTPVTAGETVFAIGTPLDKDMAGTLTRGVVSASRTIEGLPFIQSDVTVMPGNSGGPLVDEAGQIAGLTVSGRVYNGVPAGLNFFIPIADALRVLQIWSAP